MTSTLTLPVLLNHPNPSAAARYRRVAGATNCCAAPAPVRVFAEAWEDGWVVGVADGGPGIAREHLDRVFKAFARGETRGRPGVGLGLTIASRSAALLGGRIGVESKAGTGATFRLFVPDAGRRAAAPEPGNA